jgi:hypothetical protein
MTMHMVGPYLTTTGKSKTKRKFRSAEEAKRARELESSWQDLKSKWNSSTPKQKNTAPVTSPVVKSVYIRDTGPRPASLNTFHTGPVSSKPSQFYTGTKIVGIGTLHKSNAVPIFSDQEAEDIAKMRR